MNDAYDFTVYIYACILYIYIYIFKQYYIEIKWNNHTVDGRNPAPVDRR